MFFALEMFLYFGIIAGSTVMGYSFWEANRRTDPYKRSAICLRYWILSVTAGLFYLMCNVGTPFAREQAERHDAAQDEQIRSLREEIGRLQGSHMPSERRSFRDLH